LKHYRIYVGCLVSKPAKAQRYQAGALIDEFCIASGVLWQGIKIGDKVFTPDKK
jgi:hypothetical protein